MRNIVYYDTEKKIYYPCLDTEENRNALRVAEYLIPILYNAMPNKAFTVAKNLNEILKEKQ